MTASARPTDTEGTVSTVPGPTQPVTTTRVAMAPMGVTDLDLAGIRASNGKARSPAGTQVMATSASARASSTSSTKLASRARPNGLLVLITQANMASANSGLAPAGTTTRSSVLISTVAASTVLVTRTPVATGLNTATPPSTGTGLLVAMRPGRPTAAKGVPGVRGSPPEQRNPAVVAGIHAAGTGRLAGTEISRTRAAPGLGRMRNPDAGRDPGLAAATTRTATASAANRR